MAERETPSQAVLMALGEHFAAGYFEEPAASPMQRLSRAVRRRFEHRKPMPYDGGLLYPCGPCYPPDENRILAPSYSFTWSYNDAAVDARLREGEAPAEPCQGDAQDGSAGASPSHVRETLLALRETMRAERDRLWVLRTPHTVGGAGYTHSIPNYARVLREGLNEHARRIATRLENTSDEATRDLCLGLQDVLAGIRAWHANLLACLRQGGHRLEACATTPLPLREGEGGGLHQGDTLTLPSPWKGEGGGTGILPVTERLIRALERVPFEPARDFFEAVVAYNFVYYLDDCDNPGRVDQELLPYYRGEDVAASVPLADADERRDASRSDRDEALALLTAFAGNVQANWGWSESIGGTTPDGGPAYNDLTPLCIQAARGKARPSLQLRVRKDMPDAVWDAALDLIASGNGLPALYNEEGYLAALREAGLGICDEDLSLWNGGGCTETMIHGCSNVGSLDAGLNMPLVLVETLDKHLAAAANFDGLLTAVKHDLAVAIGETCALVSMDQRMKALYRPQPMRSLLIDDCIERGVEFNAGGARYHWSVINVAGLGNVADSLAAIREVVFEKREKTSAELLDTLHRNFEGEEPFRRRLAHCPRFGNNNPRVDDLAADIAEFVFRQFLGHRPWRGGCPVRSSAFRRSSGAGGGNEEPRERGTTNVGGKFLPSTIMFVTFADAGAKVGATPDGRRAGEPIADSVGPVQGRDRSGAAAMLASVARLPLRLAAGTPILNARFAESLFDTPAGRRRLRDLIETYFELGGLQLQINVVDQAVLRDAIAHPERHTDLVIRVGGYSAFFNDLPLAVKQSILDRTEYAP